MGHVVLFVDDEQKVLDSIKRALHRESYTVEIALGPIMGLQKIDQCAPSIIVTDMRMPEMDGIAFLMEAQKKYSNAIYMVLSAYSDIEKIMAAINEQHVWRYISKPWQNEELKLTILNAIEMFEYRENKKQLMISLDEKNRQLKEINFQLEERVKERTLQLQEKNEILQLMIDDAEMKEILKKICCAISSQLSISPVFIDVPFLKTCFSDTDATLPDDLKLVSQKSMVNGKEIIDQKNIAMPILKSNNVLGALLMGNKREISEFKLLEIAQNYLPLGAVCLMMAKTLQDTPALNDKLDELLGEL